MAEDSLIGILVFVGFLSCVGFIMCKFRKEEKVRDKSKETRSSRRRRKYGMMGMSEFDAMAKKKPELVYTDRKPGSMGSSDNLVEDDGDSALASTA